MPNINPFITKGKWYKGNLHCHTTNSDGRLSPKQVAEYYKNKGWNFLAFTEHDFFKDNSDLCDDNYLILPGVELGISSPDPVRHYHIVGIGNPMEGRTGGFDSGEHFHHDDWKGVVSAQNLIDDLKNRKSLAIFCHPNWSRLEYDDFRELVGYSAIEVFNYGCEVECHTGLSTEYWDSLLRRGRKIWGIASDDAHHALNDRCGGWVMVKAEALTYNGIFKALTDGSFYSSNGPEVYEYEMKDGEVVIECSPVNSIHFVTYENVGCSFWGENGKTICSARYKLTGHEKYVRVECKDKYGNTAWTNPIFL